MKTTLFIVGIGLWSPYTMLAQAPDVIRIKGGVGGEKMVPVNDRYRYNQFRDGNVLYQNGTSAAARFNYNIVLGEMQFIDPRGDTLALANEPVVRLVSLGGPSSGEGIFWYEPTKGYLEVIAEYKAIKLAVKRGLKLAKSEKMGGYEQSSGSSAITTYQFYSSGNASVHKLDEKGDLVLIKDRTYFMIDQNNRTYPVNRASLLKVFGKYRDQVTAYLTRESVNFKQEEDLGKLLKYCSELSN